MEQEKRAAFQQNPHTESAIMAVYAFANALKKAHETLCPGGPGLCSALTDITPQQFHDIFLKVRSFTLFPVTINLVIFVFVNNVFVLNCPVMAIMLHYLYTH